MSHFLPLRETGGLQHISKEEDEEQKDVFTKARRWPAGGGARRVGARPPGAGRSNPGPRGTGDLLLPGWPRPRLPAHRLIKKY